jgi:hypothetical protein
MHAQTQPPISKTQTTGLPIVGAIDGGGYLEGGDFFPLGQDLAMVGIGLRSNLEACQQLMQRDLLGTRRFAVVRDDFDRHQDRMHLDCVFSVLGGDVCIMLEVSEERGGGREGGEGSCACACACAAVCVCMHTHAKKDMHILAKFQNSL